MDLKKYPPDWKEISRRVRERSGGRCECEGECGQSHRRGGALESDPRCPRYHGEKTYLHGGIRLRKRPVVLTVGHLDHNPASDDESRMRAWCESCHLRYDAEHHRRNASATRARKLAAGTIPLFEAKW